MVWPPFTDKYMKPNYYKSEMRKIILKIIGKNLLKLESISLRNICRD